MAIVRACDNVKCRRILEGETDKGALHLEDRASKVKIDLCVNCKAILEAVLQGKHQ